MADKNEVQPPEAPAPPAAPPAAPAASSAELAKRGDKTRREIELEIKLSQAEDQLTGKDQQIGELEKFIRDFQKPPPAAVAQPAREGDLWRSFFGW